ncbi:hypothetical protein [Streptomyces sp. MP131-18]|uniref:hypothetical protein n=1 Tax=Streptomyces sp. MP131-18 TaxID=1857892 RepID=UPI00097BDB7E|nr:hypothetical protein [Streptomyces sp. MP131-18]ONK09496.1 hypothetical protein STBA_01960 [Streptomyces sp. MP131-18]
MSDRPHGYARYRLDGCRCYTCAWARAEYDRRRTMAITAGTWQPWTDAAPVREHIQVLQSCGVGLRTIASAAGIDRKRLQALLRGRPERGTPPQAQVRPALAAAVLAVEPTRDTIAPGTPVVAVGTVRRLQALVAAGWPQAHLAAQLGMTGANFGPLLRALRVTAGTARAVRDLYDRLCLADPAEHGASPGGITRARRMAVDRRWAPMGAWDDDTIDDPAPEPDWTGQCGTPSGYYAHRTHRIPACGPCRDAYRARRRETAAQRALATA